MTKIKENNTLKQIAKDIAEDLLHYKFSKDNEFFNELVEEVSKTFEGSKEDLSKLLLTFVKHPDTVRICEKWIPLMFETEPTASESESA